MAVGRILRYDEVRGYGFIAASAGGEDVFVHANDFGEQRHLVHPGLQVEYEVEEGDRGLKAASVRILDARSVREVVPPARPLVKSGTASDDDALCDVLSERDFATQLTELMLQRVPTLTGSQIVELRACVGDLARRHGWVEP
jgi:cold shock protein